jgi:AcrR family transcriptional regulator
MRRAPRAYQQTARAESALDTARRILKATGELLMERWYDDVALEDIAARAGVTTKTIQRRFMSKENLARQFFISAGQENSAFRDQVPVGDPPAAVASIAAMYEVQGDAIMRYLALEHRIPLVAEVIAGGRELHHRWVERVFSPLLLAEGKRQRLAQLVVATDVYAWKLLRRDLGLSAPATRQSMLNLVNATLSLRKDDP